MANRNSNKTIVATMVLRRGYEKDMPFLREGELAFSVDTHKVFIGTSNGNMEVFAGTRDTSKLEKLENENKELRNELQEMRNLIARMDSKTKILERIDNTDITILKRIRCNGGKL